MPRFLSIALLAFSLPCAAAPPDDAAVAGYIDSLLAEHVPVDGAGMAVLVARGDRVVHRTARGRAHLELEVPLKPSHVMRIASITKQFTAAAILKLAEDGKLALSDPLSKFFPDYPAGDTITLSQLLDHTSGVKSYTDLPDHADRQQRDLDTAQLIAVFRDQPADFPPGKAWHYSNSGYVLLGAIIEKLTGQPWHEHLRQTFFVPLQMQNTQHGDDRLVLPGLVQGYSVAPGQPSRRAVPMSMTQPHAAGALVSSLDDLLRWNLALHEGRLLQPASYARMTTPQAAADAGPAHYGYGLFVDSLRGEVQLWHGGDINGFTTMLAWLPASRVSLIVLRNADGAGMDAGQLAMRIGAYMLGKPFPTALVPPPPPAVLAQYEGRFTLGDGLERVLRVRNGGLTSQRTGGQPLALQAVGNDGFLFAGQLSGVRFERSEQGQLTALRFFPIGLDEGISERVAFARDD